MIGRLRYLFEEGFAVSSLMGYDAENEFEMGIGKILYRVEDADGKWRVMSESFEVSYDEMQSCAAMFLQRIRD